MTQSFGALQAHALGRLATLELPKTAKALTTALRVALFNASDARLLTTSPSDITKRLKATDPPDDIAKKLDSRKGVSCIFGGAKNQDRDISLAHFARSDGAWFDFTITVRERGHDALELLAYDFEIRLPQRCGTPFVRFDLNLPGHANEERELRCHVHPGSDDVLLPAPLMGPLELLDLFIHQVQPTREARVRSTFEMNWFQKASTLG
jgi:hypothetical protein